MKLKQIPLPPSNIEFRFTEERLGIWIKNISDFYNKTKSGLVNQTVTIILPDNLNPSNIKPVHLVTLACLIANISISDYQSGQIVGSNEIINYLKNVIHLPQYFDPSVYHIRSEMNYDLNLWKVSSEHSPFYSQKVAEYLRNKYFVNKDLSGLKVILDELYANISDHSKSKGVAYSYIKFNQSEEKISIAFCDFGIGIKASLASNNIKVCKNVIE